MKLVLATPLYPPEIGGPATYAEILATTLPKEGVEVEVVKFRDVGHLPKVLRHYQYYRKVLRAAANADLILALDPVSVGLPASWAARKAGKPFVVKVVGDYAWEQGRQRFGVTEDLDHFIQNVRVPLPVAMLRKVQTSVSKSAAKVIVPSQYLKEVVTAWGVPSEKVVVIYNAVSLPPLGTVPERVQNLQKPFVVTAGRLVPWKHVDGVIDAVAQMPDMALVVVGDGPDRAKLEEHATPLRDRVIFTGQLAHADLLAVLKVSDGLVLNSSYEGLSHLLVEAVLLEIPVVATKAGGNVEVIEDGVNGALVSVGDTDALARAIAARKAPKRVAEHTFSQSRMIRETAALLKEI